MDTTRGHELISDVSFSALTVCGLLVYYFTMRSALTAQPSKVEPSSQQEVTSSVDKASRRRAWILTLLVSAVFTLVSAWYVAAVGHVFWVAFSDRGLAEAQYALYGWLMGEDGLYARPLTLGFIAFMVTDLAVGLVDYRRNIDPLSGWVHHLLYTALLLWFGSLRICNLFMALSPCELPTLLLSVGCVWPERRVDLPMGVAFAATRLVWFAAVAHVLPLFEGPTSTRSLCAYAILLLHLHWFRGWTRSYAKRRARLAADARARAENASPALGALAPASPTLSTSGGAAEGAAAVPTAASGLSAASTCTDVG